MIEEDGLNSREWEELVDRLTRVREHIRSNPGERSGSYTPQNAREDTSSTRMSVISASSSKV